MATNLLRERLLTVLCVGLAAVICVMAIRDGSIHHVSGVLKVAGILAVVLSFAAHPKIFSLRHDTDAQLPRTVQIGLVAAAAAFVVASAIEFAGGLGYAF